MLKKEKKERDRGYGLSVPGYINRGTKIVQQLAKKNRAKLINLKKVKEKKYDWR